MKTHQVTVLGFLAAFATGCTMTDELTTNSAAQTMTGVESYPFPGRQVDLPAATYWKVAGDHGGTGARDLVNWHWDGAGWTGINKPFDEYAADPRNEDHIIYDKPVFSPVHGTIVSCWRNSPEGIRPEVHKGDDIPNPGRTSSPKTILQAGNHVNILSDDGTRIILLAHLRPGTVPPHLCPFNDTHVLDADNKLGEFPREATIPVNLRPHVTQGEVIGHVGSSGAASLPHLHVHLKPVTGSYSNGTPQVSDAVPMPFHGVYTKAEDASGDFIPDWVPTVDAPLGNSLLVHASPYLKTDTITEPMSITETAALATGGTAITAVRETATGNLRLRSFGATDLGQLVALDEASAGAATQIAMARAGLDSSIVTALRDGAGDLELINWRVSASGGLTRRGFGAAGAVSKIAIAEAPSGLGVVTAVRDSSGLLKLITWSVDEPNATVTRVATFPGGPVNEIAIATVSTPFRGVVVATRDGNGNLHVDSFAITPALDIIARDSDGAGAATSLQAVAVRVDANTDHVVTAMRDGTGVLRLIDWSVSATGGLTRLGDDEGGPIADLELVRGRPGDVITASRNGQELRLITWRFFTDGRIERHGETVATSVGSAISVTAPFFNEGGNSMVLASFQNAALTHGLIGWVYTN